MTEKNIPAYEQNYTAEERELIRHLIGLEEAALKNFSTEICRDTVTYSQIKVSPILMPLLPSEQNPLQI